MVESRLNTELQDDLSLLLNRLSLSDYKYAMVLRDPDGVTEFLSSHPVSDQKIMNQLSRLVIGQELSPTEPPASSTSVTEEGGVVLHRTVMSPSFHLSMNDNHKVETHIRNCLRELQQVQCKIVAKAWIKMIEPKKQTSYPYKLGDACKPPWWPQNVKHVEPDHLNMQERLTLMVTIVLRSREPVEKLWMANRAVSGFSEYKSALLDEIIFVARSWRSQSPQILVVSDWDNCPKSSKKQIYLPFTINTKSHSTKPHDEVESANIKKEELDDDTIPRDRPVVVYSANYDNYMNPVVAFNEDLRRSSLNTTVGSLSLYNPGTHNNEHSLR